MGRKSSFTAEAVYAAAGREVAQKGRVTLQALSGETGLSMGSLYHRFQSREGLLAEAWLHAVRAFQAGFLQCLDSGAPDAGLRAALETPRFCRAEPGLAIILAGCRQADFIGAHTPPHLAAALAGANTEVAAAVAHFAERMERPLLACKLALIAYPLAAVRLFLPEQPVPESVDAYVRNAYRAAMA
jgi:AcrR family transcriptional regulator